MKKCIYCKREINHESLIDFCEICGKRVFGDKMFAVIIQNMNEASRRGDLEQTRF